MARRIIFSARLDLGSLVLTIFPAPLGLRGLWGTSQVAFRCNVYKRILRPWKAAEKRYRIFVNISPSRRFPPFREFRHFVTVPSR